MATARTLARIDTAIWVLIYGGLFCIVLGIATGKSQVLASWSLAVLGGIAVVAGIVLIAVRSRLREAPPPGAQSSPDPTRGQP
jgi:hypothetical protein